MKILLVSYFASDANTARAFRVKSLITALCSLGHDVQLITATSEKQHDKLARHKRSRLNLYFRDVISRVLNNTLPDGIRFVNSCRLYARLKNLHPDLLISIGLPFSVHLMVALAISTGRISSKKSIADYGDPFSGNKNGTHPFYAKYLERWVLSRFDKVAIPIDAAISAYDKVVQSPNQIEVIPQGCNIRRDYSKNYVGNSVAQFAYAGILYKGIRDPSPFLEELTRIGSPFEFHFYTDLNNTQTMQILAPYLDKLRGKLHIYDKIPRDTCVELLSRMDFLVSFSNRSAIQAPSKIIDYTLSSRPFVEISEHQKDFHEFKKYLSGDYSTFSPPDITRYDEITVANQFINSVFDHPH